MQEISLEQILEQEHHCGKLDKIIERLVSHNRMAHEAVNLLKRYLLQKIKTAGSSNCNKQTVVETPLLLQRVAAYVTWVDRAVINVSIQWSAR